ncbi:MAG: ATP-binding protein, partial [Anaerolineales bacterium]
DEYEEEARLARMTAHEIEGTSEGPSARVLRVPVRTQDGLYATLEFEAEADGEAWSQDDRLLVEAISQQLGTAIQDARTHALTQQALVEMREADRLKTQFLANMSHELRTPLNSIIGFSRVILKGIDGPISDLQEQDLRAIYNAGLHLLGLINDILDLSKIEARKMELALADLDLAEMIRGVMATAVGLVHDKPVELGVDVPQDLPRLQADTMRVRQILLNLVSNAAKFTERGRIDVVARLTDRQGIPEIEVAVSDTGPGIDTQAQAKLFEPFTQVDSSSTRKTGGTGLGLSICRHLVELHGGRIWVESVAGQGSTFKFTLPLRPPAGALVESGAAST